MALRAHAALVWPAMILSGLVLGAFAFAAWPDSNAMAKPTSANAEPGRELAGVAGSYSGDIFVYELRSTMLIDSIMSTPQPVDAH